ncbi:gluconate permease, partial [Winslowiella iniecta]
MPITIIAAGVILLLVLMIV